MTASLYTEYPPLFIQLLIL